MAKQLISIGARASRAAVLRAYLFREGAILIAALAVAFVIVRLFIPRLVNAHSDLLLVLAGVLVLVILGGGVWFGFYVRTQFKAFRRRYEAARDD